MISEKSSTLACFAQHPQKFRNVQSSKCNRKLRKSKDLGIQISTHKLQVILKETKPLLVILRAVSEERGIRSGGTYKAWKISEG